MPAYWKEGKFGDANQYDAANNLHYDPRATRKKLNQHVVDYKRKEFWPRPGSSLIDTGKPIEGITDGFVGKAPDRGAYEAGGPQWIPGVDGTTGKQE